jgi:quinol monooxygenase YgiN
MLIIAGHTEVDPDDQDEALAFMRDLLTRARDAPGRVVLAITTDSVDPTRINYFERWESQEALDTARSNGPGFE